MADYDVQVVLHSFTALPRDAVVNTFHFDVNFPDTLNGLCDDIAAAYATLAPIVLGDVNGMTVKVYLPGLNPAGPVFEKSYAAPNVGATSGPGEVAICLSYTATDNVAAAGKRRRGRVYIGRLKGSILGTAFVQGIHRDAVLAFGQSIGSAGNAGNTTWKMHSRMDNVYVKIEAIFVDDAWDTQRRRGKAPSVRQVQDVQ